MWGEGKHEGNNQGRRIKSVLGSVSWPELGGNGNTKGDSNQARKNIPLEEGSKSSITIEEQGYLER